MYYSGASYFFLTYKLQPQMLIIYSKAGSRERCRHKRSHNNNRKKAYVLFIIPPLMILLKMEKTNKSEVVSLINERKNTFC